MQQMVNENKSIREIAKELGIAKSTLHYRLEKCREKIDDEYLLITYDILMKENKTNMSQKGVKARLNKK